jgi:hypothetical protein
MKVFISWSGDQRASQRVASMLHEWLPSVIQAIDPWISKAGLDAGTRWSQDIASQLEATDYGIVCVTRNSQLAPWLNFEAGALSKKVAVGRVVPFLIDLTPRELQGPLSQFHGVAADEAGARHLVNSINELVPKPLSKAQLEKAFTRSWPDLKDGIAAARADEVSATPLDDRDLYPLLVEVLSTVRGLAQVTHVELADRVAERLRGMERTKPLKSASSAGEE